MQRLNLPNPKTCGKKRLYDTKAAEEAKRLLEEHDRKHRPSCPKVAVYHCQTCDALHVGHSS